MFWFWLRHIIMHLFLGAVLVFPCYAHGSPLLGSSSDGIETLESSLLKPPFSLSHKKADFPVRRQADSVLPDFINAMPNLLLEGLNGLSAGFANTASLLSVLMAVRGKQKHPAESVENWLSGLIPDDFPDDERLRLLESFRQTNHKWQQLNKAGKSSSPLFIARVNGNLNGVLVAGQTIPEPLLERVYTWLLDLELAEYLRALSVDGVEESLENLLDLLPELEATFLAAAGGDDGDPDRDPDDDREPGLFIAGEYATEQWMPYLHDQSRDNQKSPSLYNQSMMQKLRLLRVIKRRAKEAMASGQTDLARILENRVMVIEADLSDLASNKDQVTASPSVQSLLLAGLLDNFQELQTYQKEQDYERLSLPESSEGYTPVTLLQGQPKPGRQVPESGSSNDGGSENKDENSKSAPPSSSGSSDATPTVTTTPLSKKNTDDDNPEKPEGGGHTVNCNFCSLCGRAPCTLFVKLKEAEDIKQSITCKTRIEAKVVQSKVCKDNIEGTYSHRFACFMNSHDLFYLGVISSGVVIINDRPVKAVNHLELGKGEVYLNPYLDLHEALKSSSVIIKSLNKELPVIKRVILKLNLPESVKNSGNLPIELIENGCTESLIKQALYKLPIVEGQKYLINLPVEGNPKRMCLISAEVNRIAGEMKQDGPFLLDEENCSMAFQFPEPGQLCSHIKRIYKSPANLVYITGFSLERDDEITDGTILTSPETYVALAHQKPEGVTSEEPVIFKIGQFCYFASIRTNNDRNTFILHHDRAYKGSTTIKGIQAWGGQLENARQCDVTLDWLDNDKAHLELKEEGIRAKVRDALKRVPLQPGRPFLIPVLFREDDYQRFSIIGKIDRVVTSDTTEVDIPDGDSEAPGKLPILDDNTKLTLTAADPFILSGEKPEMFDKEQIFIGKMCEGLPGMEEIGKRIYNDVYLAWVLYQEEKVESFPAGVLLYGPPGTGKSHLTNNLIKVFGFYNARTKVLKVSDFLLSTVAESVKSLEKIFHYSRHFSSKDELNVFVIQDIDQAFMAAEDSPNSPTNVQMALRKRLQELMSGDPHSIKNSIIFATSNRKIDDFDQELTRPQRFSISINVANPNKTQRIAILDKYFKDYKQKKGWDIESDSIHYLAGLTAEGSSAFLVELANSVIRQGELRLVFNKSEDKILTTEDCNKALYDPNTISMAFKKVMDTFGEDAETSTLFTPEDEAIESVEKHLTRLTNQLGKKGFILVKARGYARGDIFFHHLMLKVKGMFDHFASSTSPEEFTKALQKTGQHGKSLILIPDLQPLLEKGILYDPKSLGRKWMNTSRSSNKRNIVVVALIENKWISEMELNEETNIPIPSVNLVDMKSTLKREEIKSYMQALSSKSGKIPTSTIDEILDIFNTGSSIIGFTTYLDNYRKEDNAEGLWQWDFEAMKEAIKEAYLDWKPDPERAPHQTMYQ